MNRVSEKNVETFTVPLMGRDWVHHLSGISAPIINYGHQFHSVWTLCFVTLESGHLTNQDALHSRIVFT